MNWFSFRKPTPRLRVGPEALYKKLREAFPGDYDIRLGDREYVSLTENEAFQCVRNVATAYIPETNDCDDVSNLAKGEAIRKQRKGTYGGGVACFGQVWLPTHAVNFFMDVEGRIRVIDNDGSERVVREVTLILV